MSLVDQVVAFCQALGGRVLRGENVYNLSGIGDFAGFGSGKDNPSPSAGEGATDQLGYGPLGYFAQPLPPDATGQAESVALRTDGGLNPFAWRDLRAQADAAPGQMGIAGYGGGLITHSLTTSGGRRATITTLYVPYAFDGAGVAQKALTVTVDPSDGNPNITLAHADGVFLSLQADGGNGSPGVVMAMGDGATFLRMSAGELTLQAAKILLKGNVYLGREAELGVQLFGGPITPASPSVFVSPV